MKPSLTRSPKMRTQNPAPMRAGHHRLLVSQQRHGGAYATDQEPAQVPVHAAASPCLLDRFLLLLFAFLLGLLMTKDVVVEHGESSKAPLVAPVASGVNRAVSIIDVFLRFIAIIGTIGSAISMGTTNETLPFFTQFIQFEAKYSDLPSFT
ncbi:hypothetical protein PR202_gb15400 [Eleusine coracana subsp. coracana]|uniref:CASP-like protein n=1 Tax=Eleusine coracana subsp. coracana TaxID=191504 RepID=A0AAV5EXI8_ELECO|nr:hypothetical protein PR202_gb15400 [Eleusine coracana subsp. coracana]